MRALQAQREWLARTPHAGTPSLFLNGRPMAPEFSLSALVYFARAAARQAGAVRGCEAA